MTEKIIKVSRKYLLSEAVDYADGAIVSKVIAKNNAGNITLFAFDRKQTLSEHTAPFDALVQVIEGDVVILIDGNENLLGPGELIIMPANIPHAVEAKTPCKMILTMLKA